MEINTKKKLAASLSICSNIVLTVSKIVLGIISGSLSIISEAVHSASDFVASVLTFFSVIKSSKPADKDHPYGHGKYEDLSGFIEGLLIIFAALFIIYKASAKIILSQSVEFESTPGIIVMCAAVVLNFLVSTYLFKVSKESNSISLYADGEHLRVDVYSSLGVLAGLILIKLTGYTLLDPIIAILIAVFIYKTGYSISKRSVQNLLDHSLPIDDIEKIKGIVKNLSVNAKLKRNGIRARQVGPTKDIDLILQFPEDTSICECHKICDEIEGQIQTVFQNSSISIHPEPICYSKKCNKCCDKQHKNQI